MLSRSFLLSCGRRSRFRTVSGLTGSKVQIDEREQRNDIGNCFVKGSGTREMALALELAKEGKRVSLILEDGSLRTIVKCTPSSDELLRAVADAPVYSFPEEGGDRKQRKGSEAEEGRRAGRAILSREYSNDMEKSDDTGYDGKHQ